MTVARHAADSTELLQAMIRNRCVNDGTPDSGGEDRNADLLTDFFDGAGVDLQRYESRPGRGSIVARIEGSDPSAPSLCLMGHTDVVPVNPDGWSRDPFGGEIVPDANGRQEIWGRGALDMLSITATMAVAFRRLVVEGFRPRGSLIYFGVADEEAGGTWGAEYMCDHHWDVVGADYVLTETGGWSTHGAGGVHRVAVTVAEKGIAWLRLRVSGTPSHGSMPYGADNALITAAEIIRRVAAFADRPQVTELWLAQLDSLGLPADLDAALRDPARLDEAIAGLDYGLARRAHACTHMTMSPNVAHGGQKTNTVPDVVDLDLDIRTLPGQSFADVEATLTELLGELAPRVEITVLDRADATSSPTDTALWRTLAARTQVMFPGAELEPGMMVGGTDGRFFRDRGSIAYGAALLAPDLTLDEFSLRFHGNDERIDLDSIALSTDYWYDVAREVVG